MKHSVGCQSKITRDLPQPAKVAPDPKPEMRAAGNETARKGRSTPRALRWPAPSPGSEVWRAVLRSDRPTPRDSRQEVECEGGYGSGRRLPRPDLAPDDRP